VNWWQQMLRDVVTTIVPVAIGAFLHWFGVKTGTVAVNGAKRPPPPQG